MPNNKQDTERTASYAVPTTFSNRFYVDSSNGHTRIAFAEQPGDGEAPQYRTAVLLSNENAFRLAELLMNILTPEKDDGTHEKT